MALIPWNKIIKVYTDLITADGTTCKIYERKLTKLTSGETAEELNLIKENIDIIFLNNSGNTNIFAAGIINNAVITNSSHSGYILFQADLPIIAYKHILEVEGVKYNINFVNDFGNKHFGLQLNCELLKTGI